MTKLEFKKGDTHNAIYAQLLRLGKALKLHNRRVYISFSDIIKEDQCQIVDEEQGMVAYPVENISHEAGKYYYEFTVVYEDGTREKVPNDQALEVKIYNSIGGDLSNG